MKNRSLTYYLAVVLVVEILFVFWKLKAIIDAVVSLQYLKQSFEFSVYHTFWFYGMNVFSVFLVVFSSILLFVGCFKALYSGEINRLIITHICINFSILIFCFPLTLMIGSGELVGLMGIKIVTDYVYVFIILAQVILYAMIRHKEIVPADAEKASSKQRFLNLLIDTGVIVFLILLIRDIFTFNFNEQKLHARILLSLVVFLYYFLMELVFRQTVGKIVTNTHVVNSGSNLTQMFIRALCRLIPFYQLSPLIGDKQPWHDKFSKTRVVKISKG